MLKKSLVMVVWMRSDWVLSLRWKWIISCLDSCSLLIRWNSVRSGEALFVLRPTISSVVNWCYRNKASFIGWFGTALFGLASTRLISDIWYQKKSQLKAFFSVDSTCWTATQVSVWTEHVRKQLFLLILTLKWVIESSRVRAEAKMLHN